MATVRWEFRAGTQHFGARDDCPACGWVNVAQVGCDTPVFKGEGISDSQDTDRKARLRPR